MVLTEDRNKTKIADQKNPNIIKMCLIELYKHVNNKSVIFYRKQLNMEYIFSN